MKLSCQLSVTIYGLLVIVATCECGIVMSSAVCVSVSVCL